MRMEEGTARERIDRREKGKKYGGKVRGKRLKDGREERVRRDERDY